jgi:hypothetical protein
MPEDTKVVTPQPLPTSTTTLDKDGNTILSDEIRQQQKDAKLVPDTQPKIGAGEGEEREFDPTKTQPTGNVMVAHAVNATAADVGAAQEKGK